MKHILLLFSMYACLPCYAMEEQPTRPVASVEELQSLLQVASPRTVQDSSKERYRPTKAEHMLAGNPATPARIKRACKKTLSLWIVPVPLSLVSIPVGLYCLEHNIFPYAHWVMNGVSLTWAALWLTCHYKKLSQEREAFVTRYNALAQEHVLEDNYLNFAIEEGSTQQVETECLLDTYS